jgi:hypothetical protein
MPISSDTGQKQEEAINDSIIHKDDILNSYEKEFITKLLHENEFLILSERVRRYYFTKDSSLVLNELVFKKEYLLEKGYTSFEMRFYGKISEPNLYYSYSLGQASYGFGSVIGSDTINYLHSLKSCGISACITQLFENGKKIVEKSN